MGKSDTSRRHRGERAGLSRQSVVDAAMAVYREGGIDALTMRSVSRRLGVAPNALYTHVDSKTSLVDAVVDVVLGEIEIPADTTDWRQALRLLMVRSRTVLLRHAALMQQFLARPTRGHNALALGETTLRLLALGGIHGTAAVTALRVLLVYTIGFAAQEAPRLSDPSPASRRRASEAAYRDDAGRPLSAALAGPLSRHADDTVFMNGLDWLLDGITAGVTHQAT